MWRNARIGTKLLVSFGAMFAVALFLGGISVYGTRALTGALEQAVNVTARRQQLAGQIGTTAAEMLNSENGIVLGAILQRGGAVSQSKQQFTEQAERMKKTLLNARPLCDSSMLSSISSLEATLGSARRAHEDMMQYLDKQQFDLVQKTFDEFVQPRLREISGQAESLIRQENDRLNNAAETAQDYSSRSYWALTIMLMLASGAGAIVLLIIHQINRTLRDLAGQINRGAQQFASAAAQVCGASQSLAECSSEQAAALEETSASMEEMGSVTHKNTGNSRSTVGLMNETENAVCAAERTVRELGASMLDIGAAGEKITKVIKMIDDIAFQTRILSLNAAVEAARAGVAGAGFAVVAEQVGQLAQECAQAAHSTADMIDDTVTRVREGSGKLGRAGEAIQEVVKNTARMRVLVDEVNVGSEEQSKGIDEVSQSVLKMQQMTEKTAANAEQTASAGQELRSNATALNGIVAKLHHLVGGVDTPEAAILSIEPIDSSLAALRKATARAGHRPSEFASLPWTQSEAASVDVNFTEF